MLSEKDQRDLKRLEIGYYLAAAGQIGVAVYTWFAFQAQAEALTREPDVERVVGQVFAWLPPIFTGLALILVPSLIGLGILVRLSKARKTLFGLAIAHCILSPVGIFPGIATLILMQRRGIDAYFRRGERPSRPGDLLHVE